MQEAKDPQSFREFEFSGWQQSVDEYNNQFSPLTQQTIPAIIDSIASVSDKKVLDVACGPGDLSTALAQQGAQVTAVDFAPAMIERAIARNTDPNITFQVGDAEALKHLPDATFDAVVMNYGILHLGRPTLAIREAGRVLKPGGRFVFSCWQNPTKAQGFAVILDAVKESGAVAAGVPHGPNFFEFSENGNIETALTDANFSAVSIRDVAQTWEIKDGYALFNAFLEGTARTGGMLRKLPAADREVVRQLACKMAHDRFQNADGTLSIPMPTKVAVAAIGLS